MKVVITGGAGFIGSHAAEYFIKKGWDVTIFDNLSRKSLRGGQFSSKTYNWSYLSNLKGIQMIRGSVTQPALLDRAIRDADAVIHTAGQVAVTTSLSNPLYDFNTNVRGTFNVLEACRKSGNELRFVFCSTNKVYGENVNAIPVKESDSRYCFSEKRFANGIPENFSVDGCKHSPYGASKLSADIYVQEYGKTYNLRTGCFRMSCIYGDRQFGNEDQGWVAHFVISALRNRHITIYGNGKQVRDVLYVDDLVKAFSKFLKSNLPSAVYNIGGGLKNTLSLNELVDMLRIKSGRDIDISYGKWRNSDQKVYVSDISKAQREMKWQPAISVEEGIDRLWRWAEKTF